MFDIDSSYIDVKNYYDEILNKDKSTYKSSNDEPTPITCIEEMLDVLPVSFWQSKNIKILDPCCGNGNFHFVAYGKLKENGHEKQHILEKILHFNDVNKDRLDNVQNIFNKNKTYNMNINQVDFLNYDIQEENKFDAIIANPPYAKIDENGKRASKNHNLIQKFLFQSLNLLKPNGFLVFITPDNWMSCADRNKIVSVLTSLQMVHLNIHHAKKHFKKIGSSFTWYVVENRPYYKKWVVETLFKGKTFKDEVPSCKRNYIPLLFTNIVNTILQKTLDDLQKEKYNVETSSDLHKFTKKHLISNKNDEKHPYKLIHTPKQVVWSERPHKYQDGWKVFISTTDTYKVFIDECGMTQSIAFIRCENKEKAEKIQQVLSHQLYVFLNNICRWGNFNNIRILQMFPVCPNKNDVFEYFKLTQEEIEFVNANYK
jgi:SAM-dependent methyltransferase